MSIPDLTAPNKSDGVPTPMRYLGLFFGILFVILSRTSNISFCFSPTANPPKAYPSKLISNNFSKLSILRSSNNPPCTIPKRDLFSALSNSILDLFAQYVETSMAFEIIFLSLVSFGHSSKTIKISELIIFCI